MSPRFPLRTRKRGHGLFGRGYTVVEVMVALALLAVGGSGVIALQRVVVVGTLNTRHITSAVNVSSGVASRLQAEAASTWTGAAATPVAGTQFATAYGTQAWTLYQPTAGVPGMNVEGAPAAVGDVVAYVTFFKITTLSTTVVRVEVVTLYARHGRDVRAEAAEAPANVMAMLDDIGNTITIAGTARTRDEYGTSFITTAIVRQP